MLNFSYRLCIIPGTHQSIFVTLFLYQNLSPNNWYKNIWIVFPKSRTRNSGPECRGDSFCNSPCLDVVPSSLVVLFVALIRTSLSGNTSDRTEPKIDY